MESDTNDPVKAVEDQKVPADLLERLHQANQRFHQAKQQLEAVMGDAGYRHQERIDQAEDQVRLAEREVEQVSREIHGSLKPPPAGGSEH